MPDDSFMRTLTCVLVSAVSVAMAMAAATPATAQLGSVGIQVGMVQSRQLRERAAESGIRRGLLLGVYVDPQTPVSWLSVLAEVSYAQRGAKYDLTLPVVAGADGRVTLEAETEYLTFVLAPTVRASLGPVSVFGYAGPSTDLLLRSRSAGTLHTMLARASNQVFAVVAGAGLGVRTSGGRSLRLEVRTDRHLSAAFSPDEGDIKYRSTEFIVRIGRHPTP